MAYTDRIQDPNVTDDDRTYALLMHLSVIAHLFLTGFAILIPILMWRLRSDRSPFVDDHGREAVNFQITLILYTIIAIPIAIITCGVGGVIALIPYPLGIIGVILASMAANRGEYFRYPMTIRFLKGP